MTTSDIYKNILAKKSFLCIGLDSDINKIPKHLLHFDDPIFEFNKQIVDFTHDLVIAYKPNTAFYESMGSSGWKSLEKTTDYIKNNYPDIFLIADAKRGDIGNTSGMYAKAFFEEMNFDAVTVAPYMGADSVKPFLTFKNKFVIVLALTSNPGSSDFQMIKSADNDIFLYESVLKTSSGWGTPENIMYVIGATKAENLKKIRDIIPKHFLLIPGIGAQGGNLKAVVDNGINNQCGLIVNSSRGIIYSDSTENFAAGARKQAQNLQNEMSKLLKLS